MLRTTVPLAVLLWLAAATMMAERTAHAQAVEKGSLGLGLIIGEPIGISGKLYLGDDTALAAAVGSAILGGGIHAHVDYLLHPVILEDRDLFVLPAYVGGGVRVLDHDTGETSDLHLGARAVGGLLFDFKTIPLDAFLELAGVLEYAFGDATHGGLGIDLNVGIGARYYF